MSERREADRGFKEFMDGRDVKDSGRLLRDVLADYIRRNPKVSPKLDGRVVIHR